MQPQHTYAAAALPRRRAGSGEELHQSSPQPGAPLSTAITGEQHALLFASGGPAEGANVRRAPARYRVLLAAIAVLFLGLAIGTPRAEAENAAPPNIVLAMADDQGWGDVGYYGHKVLKTPTLDEMAKTGLRFDRFYAAAPVCSPTRGSVLTGRHPNRFGCFKWGHTLRPQEVTIAEALQKAGYTTGHFGKWHVGGVRADSPVCPGNSGFDAWLSAPNFFENNAILSREGKAIKTEGESSQVTVDAALEFMRDATKQKKPFLAVVWFGSPHQPHVATEKFKAMYKDQPAGQQNFLGEVTGIDYAMGHLRKELRELGIADNTLLWYTSDNGALPVGSTGGLRGRKGNVYEGGIRVPAIIEWPARLKKHRVIDIPCGTVDIYPTLLDIVGVEVTDQPPLDGISLVPLLEEKMQSRDKPLGFWDYPQGGISTPSARLMAELLKEQTAGKQQPSPQRELDAAKIAKKYPLDTLPGHSAWIDGDWKLHRIAGKNGGERLELYNLADDAQEANNLLDQQPDRAAKMKEQLTAWQKSVIHSLNGDDYPQQ